MVDVHHKAAGVFQDNIVGSIVPGKTAIAFAARFNVYIGKAFGDN